MSVHLVGILYTDADYVDVMFNDGSSALTHTLDTFYSLIDMKKNGISSCSVISIEGAKAISLPSWVQSICISNTLTALLEALLSIINSNANRESYKDISTYEVQYNNSFCITCVDNVFQDLTIFQKVIYSHDYFKAHYTYIEGYPKGLSPECVSLEGMNLINEILAQNTSLQHMPIQRDSLFSLLEKRIHDFDIQTELSPEDMRLYRLELRANSKRNYVISKRLWESGLRDINKLPDMYKRQGDLFIGPSSFYYMQISNINEQCIYFPFSEISDEQLIYMDLALYTDILNILSEYSPKATLALGYAGEVAVHPDISSILSLASDTFNTVYVETKGRDWNLSEQWWNEEWVKKLQWIVQIDSLEEQLYTQIHKERTNTKVFEFLQFLSKRTSKNNIYLQVTRMNINEEEIVSFYSFCKREDYQLVIQKYNNYCGVLEERKVVDISPHRRFACRHLERDMLIRINGDVQLCTQDVYGKNILGNIIDDGLISIQKKRELLFNEQIKENYKEICKNCDEYYTFNA